MLTLSSLPKMVLDFIPQQDALRALWKTFPHSFRETEWVSSFHDCQYCTSTRVSREKEDHPLGTNRLPDFQLFEYDAVSGKGGSEEGCGLSIPTAQQPALRNPRCPPRSHRPRVLLNEQMLSQEERT